MLKKCGYYQTRLKQPIVHVGVTFLRCQSYVHLQVTRNYNEVATSWNSFRVFYVHFQCAAIDKSMCLKHCNNIFRSTTGTFCIDISFFGLLVFSTKTVKSNLAGPESWCIKLKPLIMCLHKFMIMHKFWLCFPGQLDVERPFFMLQRWRLPHKGNWRTKNGRLS